MAQVPGGGGSVGSYVPEGERGAAMGTGGRFRIEPSEVEKLAQGINDAISSLELLLTRIDLAAQVAPPGLDPFSESAAEEFRNTADGGPAALLAAHMAFKQVLEDTRDTIKANASSAEGQDQTSAGSLGQGN